MRIVSGWLGTSSVRVLLTGAAVLTTSVPAGGQTAPVRLERVGTWGCLECTTGQQFAEIAGIGVTAAGATYVLDRDEPRIRVFDAAGRLMLGTGRRGDGPGELQAPFFIGADGDGSFRVVDIRTARITRYAADGSVLGTAPLAGRMPTAAAMTPARGQLLVATFDFGRRTGVVERWDAGATDGAVVVASTDGFPPSEGMAGTVDAMAVSPDGVIAIGDGRREYRIRRWDGEGRLLAPDIVRDIPRTRRTPEELEEIAARIASRMGQMRAAMEQQSQGRTPSPQAPAPDPFRHHFGTGALAFDDEGRLWVRTERGGPGATTFDLFDPRGTHLGEITIPTRVGAFDIAGGYLAGAIRLEDDVPGVGLWAIRW